MSSNALLNASNRKLQMRKLRLAQLIANEPVRLVFKAGISTAYFDLNKRTGVLPIWKEGISTELLDLLTIHEMGHALFTPPQGYESAIRGIAKKQNAPQKFVSQVMNVVEDVRINERLKLKFPGARRDFSVGYRHRFERGDYGVKTETEVNAKGFLDRINMYFKIGHVVDVKFTSEEKKLIDRIEKISHWSDVEPVVNDLIEYCKNNQEMASEVENDFNLDDLEMKIDQRFSESDGEQDENSVEIEIKYPSGGGSDEETDETDEDGEDGSGGGSGGEADEESNEETDEDGSGGGSGDDTDENGEDGNGSGSGDENGEDGDEEDGETGSGDSTDEDGSSNDDGEQDVSSGSGGSDDPGNLGNRKGPDSKDGKETEPDFSKMESDTEKAEADANKNMAYKGGQIETFDVNEYNLGNVKGYKDIGHNYSDQGSFTEWFNRTKRHVNYMVNIFEMRKQADVYRKTAMNKTGLLDTNRIHMYKVVEDVFKKSAVNPDGKNHGFIILVDTSGSMDGYMQDTRRQAVMLSMFARRLGVPFEIYTFTDTYQVGRSLFDKGDIGGRSFAMFKAFDHKMSHNEFLAMAKRWVCNDKGRLSEDEKATGGTPLNNALMATHKIAEKFQRTNRVDILNIVAITDGGATDYFRTGYSHYCDGFVLGDPDTGVYIQSNSDGVIDTDMLVDFSRTRFLARGLEKVNYINFFLGQAKGGVKEITKEIGYDMAYEIDVKSISEKSANSNKGYTFFLRKFAEMVAN